MDDLYAINAAKSEFRDCFNLADVERLLAIVDPDLVNFSDGQPSERGQNFFSIDSRSSAAATARA